MAILLFDTETTGKTDFKLPFDHPTQPDLVQLGALLTDDDGNIISTVSTLVSPMNWTIGAEAERVHGITTEKCAQYGLPGCVVLAMFNNLIRVANRVVCHNAQFDIMVMRTFAYRLAKPDRTKESDIFCTMQAYTARCKIPKVKYATENDPYKWPTLKETYQHVFKKDFEELYGGAHDALVDIRATRDVYFALPISIRKKKQGIVQ